MYGIGERVIIRDRGSIGTARLIWISTGLGQLSKYSVFRHCNTCTIVIIKVRKSYFFSSSVNDSLFDVSYLMHISSALAAIIPSADCS